MKDSREIQELMQKGLKELQSMKVCRVIWVLFGSVVGGPRDIRGEADIARSIRP